MQGVFFSGLILHAHREQAAEREPGRQNIYDLDGNVIETKKFREGLPPPDKSLGKTLRDGTMQGSA